MILKCCKVAVLIFRLFKQEKHKPDTSCVGHYWPIAHKTVTDTIGGKSAKSEKPQFVMDRFGVANEAISVNSSASSWILPTGNFFQCNTTLTMWVKKIQCGPLKPSETGTGPYGKNEHLFNLI
jgi:hypothetical protein